MPETLEEDIRKLKAHDCDKPLVIVNRYDGIDLPDDSCRLLILDSKPYSESLADKYEEICREESEIINIKISQKIEQGLGRSVRGEKDFSAIMVIGSDIVNFIRKPTTQKYFSPQTRKQIHIGIEIAELATEDLDIKTTNTLDIVGKLIRQSIDRNEDWKKFYEQSMNEVFNDFSRTDISELLSIEKKAGGISLTWR